MFHLQVLMFYVAPRTSYFIMFQGSIDMGCDLLYEATSFFSSLLVAFLLHVITTDTDAAVQLLLGVDH
jgi:hypothetical protein